MCKKRISNWCRKAKKIDALVDVALWEKIKSQFSDMVDRFYKVSIDVDFN
jgi:hypothetical protein